MKHYHKRISLNSLRVESINRLENIIHRLGYSQNDYRFNHFSNAIELIISNQELHRDLKIVRRTIYDKTNKSKGETLWT